MYDGCKETDKDAFIEELNNLMSELGDEFKEGLEEFETKLSDCNPSDHKRIIDGLENMGIL